MKRHKNKKTLTSSGKIKTANTEKLEISTSYYFETMCVEEDDTVKKGENILKYSNGTYLVASYDSVITEMPKISSVSLGQSASVSISAFEDKTLEGVVTNISSTASNGKFTVTVEFDNDGDVMLGMTAGINI